MVHDDQSIDELLLRAMKTLDDQVPPGYFEGLPSRTLTRLEDSSMQTNSDPSSGPVTSHPASASSGTLPQATASGTGEVPRDDDSGLHDIRNLASSARMRMSSKRISTSPPVDDDLLASSSGGWKAAVALPEPARMVSLPEISQADLKKAEKASRKSRPSGKIEAPVPAIETQAPVGVATEAPLHLDATPVPRKVEAPAIGARVAGVTPIGSKRKNKGALIGVLGVAVAAAAGIAIYVGTQNNAASSDRSSDGVAAPSMELRANEADRTKTAVPAQAPAKADVQSIATDDPKAKGDEKPADQAGSGSAVVDTTPPPPTVPDKAMKVKPGPVKEIGKKPSKKIIEVPGPDSQPTKGKTVKDSKVESKPEGKKKGDEPDFNDLLKEAGVDQKKKVDKPKLDKTSLSGTDFKAGMGRISGKADACFNGTQGTAGVHLTIAPSGQVTKAAVTGQFAGTPVAACVEAAVRGATFPPWDGGPQSFNYSFLLQEK